MLAPPEIGRGFFEGVYRLENRSLTSRPTPTTLALANGSVPVLCWCRRLHLCSQRIEATSCREFHFQT